MNPQSTVFFRLAQSVVSQATDATSRSEVEFSLGADDMKFFAAGIFVGLFVAWLSRRLRSKPAAWWKADHSGRIKINDLRHDDSGDSLLPVDALRLVR